MPSLKDFIFSALGGKKPKPLDLGFRSNVNVTAPIPDFSDPLPPEDKLKEIWLGTKTQPPSGTNINPVLQKDTSWTNNDYKSAFRKALGQADPAEGNMDRWKKAFSQVQEDYPYAAKNLQELEYNPGATNAKNAVAYVAKKSPRKITLNQAGAAEDPYQTLLHEIVHTNQNAAFPDPNEAYNKGASISEFPAYGASGGIPRFKRLLAQRLGIPLKEVDDMVFKK